MASQSFSMMEKLFGKQGQDLVYGTRPTREAFYLLSEKIRRDSFPVQGPWFSISDNDKADLMTQKLIDHFETWAEENFKLRTLKSIRKIVIDLIKDGKKIAKRIKSAESKFLATRHEYFIFYDLITPSSPTAEVPQRPVEVSTDTSIETIPASPSYNPGEGAEGDGGERGEGQEEDGALLPQPRAGLSFKDKNLLFPIFLFFNLDLK